MSTARKIPSPDNAQFNLFGGVPGSAEAPLLQTAVVGGGWHWSRLRDDDVLHAGHPGFLLFDGALRLKLWSGLALRATQTDVVTYGILLPL